MTAAEGKQKRAVSKTALHLANGRYVGAMFTWLSRTKVTRCFFTTLLNDVVADTLTFGQCAHAGLFDCADMHKYVALAGFRLDESKSLTGVKPLNSSNSHEWPP